jgi:hypothetical protein
VLPRWKLGLLLGVGILVLAGVGATHLGKRSTPAERPTPASQAPNGIRMVDVAESAGLRYRWKLTDKRPLRNLDTFGCGCAFVDYDGDGKLDILLVGEPTCGLFRNRGDGTFEDVTARMGLGAFPGPWKGCAVGDYDGDGYPDVLLTGYRRLLLLRNAGGAHFTDATAAAGLPRDNHNQWGSSCGFMDLDGDGDLDLVVLNYVVFNDKTPQLCELTPGVMSGCPPQTYQPEHGQLYENSNSRFVDSTRASGFDHTSGKGLAIGFCDYDDDGRIDFYAGNDGTPADLMHNEGGLRFRNMGQESGTAFGSIAGQPIAAMGVDWSDYNRDGYPDFATTAFENEAYNLFQNLGNGFFRSTADEAGITGPTFRPLGFGTLFEDVDNDGYPDLIFANGHVYDNVDKITPGSTFLQPLMLFHNEGGTRMVDIAPKLGDGWTRPILGRGSARGDYDGDGRIDMLVVDYSGAPLLFHNETPATYHWLDVTAKGAGKNRQGYGLHVAVSAGAQHWVGEISPAASYLSTSAPDLHLGLGTVTQLDTVELRWPSGKRQTLHGVKADRILVAEESAASK